VAEQLSGLCAKHHEPPSPFGRAAGASRSSSSGASGLQRRIGKSGEFLAQRWQPVKLKQALAGVIRGCRGFRQGSSLTAGYDSLKASVRSLNVRYGGPQSFSMLKSIVAQTVRRGQPAYW
jgi:hypothetical protein